MINGHLRDFMSIQEFRARHQLPSEFGVSYFMPKDYIGLGRIDRAGAELQSLQHALLDTIPVTRPDSWMGLSVNLQQDFSRLLWSINPAVGLKPSEIEYAVVGFGQVCQSFIYRLVTAYMMGDSAPTFEVVYRDWLTGTIQVSQRTFPYTHNGQEWFIRLVRHAYGRVGLIVEAVNEKWYVHDAHLACPAEGFMFALLRELTSRITSLAERAAREVPPEA